MTTTSMPSAARLPAQPALAAPAASAARWTGPSDRDAAEQAVRLLYAAAGLAPPKIVWSPSPVALARDWKVRRHSAGTGVRSTVFDTPAHRILGTLRRADGTLSASGSSSLSELSSLLAHEGQRAPVGALARVRMLVNLLRAVTGRRTWQSFRAVGISPYDYAWLLAAGLPARLSGDQAARCHALAALVANCGWVVPYQEICWLSERPVTLSLDDRGRLHCKDGPALAYSDGWRRYAWKGIEVPSAFVQHPERITLSAIDSQTDMFVRRCLIEMITPKRFIHMGGADLVMRDETGTLWRRTWPRGDGWAAVEVINGTPGPDGQLERYVLQVPPELETARAAVAWTYGMTEQQYRNLALRT